MWTNGKHVVDHATRTKGASPMLYTTTIDGKLRFRVVLLSMSSQDGTEEGRLCFDYDLEATHGEVALLSQPEQGEWSKFECGKIAIGLHQSYLMGSDLRFGQMTSLLSRLLGPETRHTALSHVELLDLWDCVLDAQPRLAVAVLGPLFHQARIVAHCQWALDYTRISQHQMARAHLGRAQAIIDRIRPIPAVLERDTIDGFRRVVLLLTGRNERAATDSTPEDAVSNALKAFGMLGHDVQGVFEVARTHYLAACALEEGLMSDAERFGDRARAVLDDHLQPVTGHLSAAEDALARLSDNEKPSHVHLLMGAIYLAQARAENGKARLQRNARRDNHVCIPGARDLCHKANDEMRRAKSSATPWLLDHIRLIDACIELEENWLGGRAKLKKLSQDPTCGEAVRAAALYNCSLLLALRGEHEQALRTTFDVTKLVPEYKAGFFRRLMLLCDPPPDAYDTEQLLKAIGRAEPEPEGNPDHRTWARLQAWRRLRSTDGFAALKNLLMTADIIRDRRESAAKLDPLVVFELVESLDRLLAGHYGNDRSPLLRGQEREPLDANLWACLSGSTKWAFYEQAYRELTGQASADSMILWESVEAEYRRRVFIPAKVRRYHSGDEGCTGKWCFASGTSASSVCDFYENPAQPEITHLYKIAARVPDPRNNKAEELPGTATLTKELRSLAATSGPKAPLEFVLSVPKARAKALQRLTKARNEREHHPSRGGGDQLRTAWLQIVPDLVQVAYDEHLVVPILSVEHALLIEEMET